MRPTDGSRATLSSPASTILELPIAPASRCPGEYGAVLALLAAIGVVIAIWQLVVLVGWRPPARPAAATRGRTAAGREPHRFVVAGRDRYHHAPHRGRLRAGAVDRDADRVAIVRWSVLRTAIASLITGLQTMPSIAWFPLAILLFGLTEQAILFVVVLGAARQSPTG